MSTVVQPKAPSVDDVIYVKWDEWEAACNDLGWDNDNKRAVSLEIDHSTIRRLRRGEIAQPSPEFITRSCCGLNRPFDAFFGFKKRWS